ncbi:MAG: hypothetical protein AAF547_03515 [Actinomycetota bacterium]
MTSSNLKRFGIPASVLVGGVTVGSLFAPIGLAAAQDAESDAESDATTEEAPAEDGERDGRRGPGKRGMKSEALTEALGLTAEEIRDGFQDGNTIADLAAEQGVDVADVEAALVAAANERLDEAVENGRIDEAEAAEKRADIEERVSELMTKDPSEFERKGRGGRGGHGGPGKGFASDVITETLGLSAEEIREALSEGQTLSDLAEAQGVDAEDLAAAMVAEATERIDGAVEDGKIDANRADELKAELEERIDGVLDGELPEREGRGFGRGRSGPRFGGGQGPAEAPADGAVEGTSA